MNIFDIIGPVMIGPSSSHTAGAVRLGRVANKLINDRKLVRVEITLSGSFAQTYKGHGTDRALLAGIMGYFSYSPEIRDALNIAMERCTVDAVARKKGKWIEQEDGCGGYYYDCSVCKESWTTIDGTPWDNGMNFCPNCGAEME